MSAPRPHWLYTGLVMHRRLRPVEHGFRYGVFFLRFPLSRLAQLRGPLFALDRFNLFSFHRADHGDGGDPLQWIGGLLRREGVREVIGEVELQTFPRVLGYVFNPVSFWYCHNTAGELIAILAEVNNTFGERHCYLLQGAGPTIRKGEQLAARKVFHVSPFFAIEGGYRFRFADASAWDGERCVARIDYADAQGDLLHTSVSGRARSLTSWALLAVFFSHPMMTLGVMARIHWQALRLWSKRLPFHRKPAPPAQAVSR